MSSHACGNLTDVVLDRAIAARARVAVLPCCHHLRTGDAGGLAGWVDRAAAIDIMRAVRLTQHGYRIWTQAIPAGDHAEEPVAHRRTRGAAPLSDRRAQRSVKFTVTVMTTGTATPFRRVGVNSHWRTASTAA